MTSIKDVLGPTSEPFARTVATWHHAPTWRARIVRWAYPDLAKALDDLAKGLESMIGPL